MKNLTLLQFGAVMASTTLEVDAERLLTADDDQSPCHGNQIIYGLNKKTRKIQQVKNLTEELNQKYGAELTIAAAKYNIMKLGTWRVKLACLVNKKKQSTLILKGKYQLKDECFPTNLSFVDPRRNSQDMYILPETSKRFHKLTVQCKFNPDQTTVLRCVNRQIALNTDCPDLKEQRCDLNNLVFQSPGNTKDMYNFSSTPNFFWGQVNVPCNYSRGKFTWLTCRGGVVLLNRDCAKEQPCDKNNLVFELPSNTKAMYDLSSIDDIFRGRVHVPCNYSRRGKSTLLTCRNGEVKPNFDCPEMEDMPCDKNNLDFQSWRNTKDMYTFSSKDNIFRGSALVSCNYNMGKKTWLMCQDGEVLTNYDCTEMEQELFGERHCPPAERVTGDPHLDFAHGCNWLVSGERTFRCKHPNANGSYSYNTVYGMGEGEDWDAFTLDPDMDPDQEPDQEPKPTKWKAKKAVCPQQ